MAKWKKQKLRLNADHTWTAPPGYRIFVADAGALRFNIPEDWVVIPTSDAIELHDRQPPNDDCLLKVSLMYLRLGIDWSGLPLPHVLVEVTKNDARGIFSRGMVHHVQRPDVEIAWYEGRFIDPNEQREACARACLALHNSVMPFITMDFWPEHLDRFGPVWDEVLNSMTVGGYIHDPRRGPLPPRPGGRLG